MSEIDSILVFDALQSQYHSNLPFVAFSKPNSNEFCAWLKKDDSLTYLNDYSVSGFVFAPFDLQKGIVLFEEQDCRILKSNYEPRNSKHPISYQSKSNDSDKVIYFELLEKAIKFTRQESHQKVVLSRKETVSYKAENCIQLFKGLLDTYKNAFTYLWFHPKVGLWLGATPEKFLAVDGSNLKTIALAGTRPANDLEREWSAKEYDEQQLVTDYLLASLDSLDIKAVKSETQTIHAGELLHLKTIISAKIDSASVGLKKIIQKLHPTPAVCGLPKEDAMQFIMKKENYDREFYTGFLGELNRQQERFRTNNKRNVENRVFFANRKKTDLYVNLRCMQIKDENAHIYIGGGITKDSISEMEWNETVEKSKTMKSVISSIGRNFDG